MLRRRSWVACALLLGLVVTGGGVAFVGGTVASVGGGLTATTGTAGGSPAAPLNVSAQSGAQLGVVAASVRTDDGNDQGEDDDQGDHPPAPVPFHVTSPADGAILSGPVTTIAGIGGGRGKPVVVSVDGEHWCTATVSQHLTWACSGSPITTPGLHRVDLTRQGYGESWGHSTFTITAPPTPRAPGILRIDGASNGVVSVNKSAVASGLTISGAAVYDRNFAGRVSVTSPRGNCSSAVAASGAFSCTLPAPAPGTFPLTATETIAGRSASASVTVKVIDDTPARPVPPDVITVSGVQAGVKTVTTSSIGSGLKVSGTAAYDPNHVATVVVRVTSLGVSCTATVASNGTYSCTLPTLSAGRYTLQVTETINGVSATKTVQLVVLNDGKVQLRTFGSWALSVTNGMGVALSKHQVKAGSSVIVSGEGLDTDASVVIELHSTPIVLAQLSSKGGTFTRTATIPASTPVGDHTIVVLVSAPGYVQAERDFTITVLPADAAAPAAQQASTPTAAPTTPPKADAPAKTYEVHNTAKVDPTYRTILSQLKPFGDVQLGPPQLAAAGGLMVGLIFLIALPAILLESTLRENYDRIFRFAEPFRRAVRPLATRITGHASGFWAWVSLYTVIVAVILAFADPNVGANLTSLRLVLALVIAQVVHDLVLVLISSRLAKRGLHMAVTPVLRPGGIVFVVGGVIITRVLELEPGVLIGAWLVLMGMGSTMRQRGVLSVIRAGVLVGVGLLAWLGYSLLTGNADTFWSVLGVESMSAVMVGALSELVIAMLPLTFLEGHEIWEWSKKAWIGIYVVVIALFALIVLPQPASWIDLTTPTIVLGVIFGSFGLLCIGVWAWFRFTTTKAMVERDEERDIVA